MMGKKRHKTTKAGYQRIICEYEKRRDNIRTEFIINGIATWNKFEGKELYGKRVKKINHRIKVCKDAIRRILVYENKLRIIDNLIIDYLGVSVVKNKKQNKLSQDAKKIFYKHCIESQIPTIRISDYVGLKDNHTPTNSRRIFTRSFSTNKANKELWHRWKKYLKNEKNEII